MISQQLLHGLLIFKVASIIPGGFSRQARVLMALIHLREFLIKREVLVLNVDILVLDLATANADTLPLLLFGLLVRLVVVGMFIEALGSVIIFLEVGELFFCGLKSRILEADFSRVNGLENMLVRGEGKAGSWDRASAGARARAMTMPNTILMTRSRDMAMFINVAILAGDHEVLKHLENHLEPLIIRIGMPLSRQVLQHRLHRIPRELAARCMVEAGILFEELSLRHELMTVLVAEKGLVHILLALLIRVQVLIELHLRLLFGLLGLRFFGLGRRIVQQMRREPFFEYP